MDRTGLPRPCEARNDGLLCRGPNDRQTAAGARVGAQRRLMDNLGSTYSQVRHVALVKLTRLDSSSAVSLRSL
jgi:hypothetical protein